MRTLVTALAALLILALPACNRGAQTVQPPSEPAPATTAPEATPPPATQTAVPTEAAGPDSVQVFFARDTERGVFVEPETRTPSERSLGVARTALTMLITERPTDDALVNLIPDGTSLLGVDLDGTTLTVDLDLPDRINLGAAFEAAMYQQIVHTGAQFATVEAVQVLDDGQTPESGHLDLSAPIEPDEFALAPIVIDSPAEGDEVDSGELTVMGTANVFEANVELRLIDPSGEVAEETFTTATCGTGCRGDWEHTFTVTEPGRWTIEAVEPDMSDGEGFGPYVIERHITVR